MRLTYKVCQIRLHILEQGLLYTTDEENSHSTIQENIMFEPPAVPIKKQHDTQNIPI